MLLALSHSITVDSPGCSVTDLSRAVMQISALVFIPLGVTRAFTTGLITFCSLQVVEPVRLVVHKKLHSFNAGEFFSPLLHSIAMLVKISRHSIHAFVDLCWESYRCECLAV